MIHHNAILLETAHSIACSQVGLGVTYEWNNKDYFDLTVDPGTMEWTSTLADTGEGTSWVSINPDACTGSLHNMYANADAPNKEITPRSCEVTFSDDAGEAEDITLTVTQMGAPV